MMPVSFCQEELLQKAYASHRAEEAEYLRTLIARKLEDLRHYEVPAMERAVAICAWGRSGSILLASYLDGHDDILMLPATYGSRIYEFFERYPSLSLRDKLIAYPVFANDFFGGDFPIAAAEYYAAVGALCEVYENWPPEYLVSSRAFFQFLHVAYSLALGRRPASPHPLMVYGQHGWDAALATRFVEDFPQARFIHTVRDPITTFDRSFEAWFRAEDPYQLGTSRIGSVMAAAVLNPIFGSPLHVMYHLIKKDQPHPGLESRTRAIRFEDLHNNTAETLGRLVGWLGLQHQSSLLESTFNGRPYIVEREGKVWSGPRQEQTLRSRRHISFTDQTLLFVVLYENFVAWNYPHPKSFGHALVRSLSYMLVFLIPMKTEIIVARAVMRFQVLPSLRRGNFRFAASRLLGLIASRLAIMWLVAGELCRRLVFGKRVLETQ